MSVSNTSIAHDDDHYGNLEIDPLFQLTNTPNLFLEVSDTHQNPIDYLAQEVSRSPNNVKNHVRRIALQFKYGSDEGLYGAVLDLFIALGNRGSRIRKRMLEGSRTRLDPSAYKALVDILDRNIDRFHPLGSVSSSVLSKGNTGTFDLVGRTTQVTTDQRDPLIEAREYIEYSQIEEARLVLEFGILNEPTRKELHLELLDLYKTCRDKANFTNIFHQIDKAENPVPGAWLEVADFLKSLDVEEFA